MSSQHELYNFGSACVTRGVTIRDYNANYNKNKNLGSTKYPLKLGGMREELSVIANNNVAVNSYMYVVHTARHVLGVLT